MKQFRHNQLLRTLHRTQVILPLSTDYAAKVHQTSVQICTIEFYVITNMSLNNLQHKIWLL